MWFPVQEKCCRRVLQQTRLEDDRVVKAVVVARDTALGLDRRSGGMAAERTETSQ